jgi:hypothetical protein
MVWTGGRERTASEFQALLGAADLQLQRVIPMSTEQPRPLALSVTSIFARTGG